MPVDESRVATNPRTEQPLVLVLVLVLVVVRVLVGPSGQRQRAVFEPIRPLTSEHKHDDEHEHEHEHEHDEDSSGSSACASTAFT